MSKLTKKILSNSLTTFCAVILLWGLLSFIEVNCYNRGSDHEYSKYNLFVVVMNIYDGFRTEP